MGRGCNCVSLGTAVEEGNDGYSLGGETRKRNSLHIAWAVEQCKETFSWIITFMVLKFPLFVVYEYQLWNRDVKEVLAVMHNVRQMKGGFLEGRSVEINGSCFRTVVWRDQNISLWLRELINKDLNTAWCFLQNIILLVRARKTKSERANCVTGGGEWLT